MPRAILAALLVLGSTALAARAGAQTADDAPPNVVLVITDDAGYGDLGSYGAPDVRTPHLDRLARDGVRLTDFYANGATCTPTRAGLIAGRYQQRWQLEYPLGTFRPADSERGLPATGRSLPQLLHQAGYATALVGKWHLGWKPEFSPLRHGFDEFFGFKSGYIDYYQHTSVGMPRGKDFFEGDVQVDVPGYTTDLFTERAVRFIERNARRPFFLDVSYNAPHWPYQPPGQPSVARDSGRHLGPFDSATSTRADYVRMLERVDEGVGRILATVERLGLRERTIVIFTNDNGGEWLSRSGPLFHHKGTVWEGGIRVPAIVRWPGRIPAGSVSAQAGMTMDLTATILAAAHARVPADARLDGMDLMPVLTRHAPEMERTLFWRVDVPRPMRAVRSGAWKLVFDGQRALLFDLRTDPGERTNLIAAHTDVAVRLRRALDAWTAEVDAEAKSATAGPSRTTTPATAPRTGP